MIPLWIKILKKKKMAYEVVNQIRTNMCKYERKVLCIRLSVWPFIRKPVRKVLD